jgi:hypothetical protein
MASERSCYAKASADKDKKTLNAKVETSEKIRITKNDAEALESGDNQTMLPELRMAEMLRHRVRYFTDGAVIGGKRFVNDAFDAARERFSEKRKDGARRMRGSAKAAAGTLWSARDLRVGV